MQVVRTIFWVLLALAVVGFVVMNWGLPQDVIFWPGTVNNPYLVEWPVGFIALVFFMVGFIPMWLYHRGTKWRLTRRIKTLENAAKAAAITPSASAAGVVSGTSSSASSASSGTTSSSTSPLATEPKTL